MTKKPRKKKDKRLSLYSDSYMQRLWRKAVRARWYGQCAASLRIGYPKCQGALECHHVIRRSHGVLRNDYRNGILLCAAHHNWVDTAQGRKWCESMVRYDYLIANDVLLPVYLREHGITRAELSRRQAAELKAVVKMYERG